MRDEAQSIMTISFACPGCAAPGSVDASAAGRPARCKHCGHRFTIPRPDQPEPEVYSLDEPVPNVAAVTGMSPERESAFVPSPGDEWSAAAPRTAKRRPASGSTKRTASRRRPWFAWQTWLVRGGVGIVLALAAIIVLVPNGTLIAACTLMALGGAMVLVGYAVGAYAAFSEDSLCGFFYLGIPLYTAYYIVTRWDDLWIWFGCSTAGVALVWLGTELARWGGVVV